MGNVIECTNVVKKYGNIHAADNINFAVKDGEIFGLVGPNGAGKTTLIEMIESLRKPDSGQIRVLGLDPAREPQALKERIGVQLQSTSIQPNLKVGEAIRVFAGLYREPLKDPESLLEAMSLLDKKDSRFRKLSGGQKQRVAIALALVNDPAVVFFDEITTGLDPQARRNMWQLVKDVRDRGKTVFLTTHYMEEAEELCDRVGVIDHGRIIALDTPLNLVKNLGAESRVLFQLEKGEADLDELNAIPSVVRAIRDGKEYVLYTASSDTALQELVRMADRHGLKLKGLRTETSNLDDVFLTITGRAMRE